MCCLKNWRSQATEVTAEPPSRPRVRPSHRQTSRRKGFLPSRTHGPLRRRRGQVPTRWDKPPKGRGQSRAREKTAPRVRWPATPAPGSPDIGTQRGRSQSLVTQPRAQITEPRDADWAGGEGAGRVQQRWPSHLRPGEPGPQQLYNSWSPEPGRKPKAQAPEDSPGKPKPRADAKGRTHPHGRVPTPGRKAAPPSPSAPLQTTLPPSTARLSSDSPGFARGQTPTVRAAC